MNPVALAVMAGLVVCFVGVLLYALSVGANWAIALLAIVVLALFVRWQ